MSDDLVRRLREFTSAQLERTSGHPSICYEAAECIERLQIDNNDQREQILALMENLEKAEATLKEASLRNRLKWKARAEKAEAELNAKDKP